MPATEKYSTSPCGQNEKLVTKKDNKNSGHRLQEFEDIFDHIGGFGFWQRVIFFCISLPDTWGAFAMLLPIFTGATPRWGCIRLQGLSYNETSLQNITWETCNAKGLDCEEFVYEPGYTSIVTEWDFVCGKDYASDFISSIQMGGLMLGAAIMGQVSDLIGRKKSFFIAMFIFMAFGFASAFANSWQLYAVCRAFVGVGFGSYMVVGCVYPLEFVGCRWRLLCGTVGFWAVGQLILALVAYLIRDWRYLTIAVSVSGAPCFLLWWVIPESPRWLIQKNRFEEASAILTTIAQHNKKSLPNISDLKGLVKQVEIPEEIHKKYTYMDLFRQWHYTKLTLVTMFIWFTSFILYYHVTFNIKHLSGNRYLNAFYSGLVDLIAMLSVMAVLNWLGRRKSLIGYVVIVLATLVTTLGINAAGKEVLLGTVIVVIAMIGKSGALSTTYICQIYSAEVYPTDVRNVGVGLGSVAGRIGGVVAPQLVFLGTLFKLTPYIITITLAVILLPLVLILPETTGRPLKDTYITKQNPTTSNDKDNKDVEMTLM